MLYAYSFISSMSERPPCSTLFPYTTLFRSSGCSVTHTMSKRSPYRMRAFVGCSVEGAHAIRRARSEEHTSELQSHSDLVCRLLLEKKKKEHILKTTLEIVLALVTRMGSYR